ncbi:MAG: GxxExxY protein [Kiloniellales bacterium]
MQSASDRSLETLTERIISAAFEVSNVLGHGFLESVYQKALVYELRQRGLAAHPQAAFRVHYKGQAIGHYYADLLVERFVVVELKAISALQPVHVGQVLNYLRASSLRVGLLLNFGRPKLEYRRVVL